MNIKSAYLVARDVVDLADGAVGLAEVGPQVGLRVRSERGNALCEVLHNLVLGTYLHALVSQRRSKHSAVN